jgi:DNA repair protein RadC
MRYKINYAPIKTIPIQDRPREKLLKNGPQSLRLEELVMIILGSGSQKYNVQDLAQKVSKHLAIHGEEVSIATLLKIPGLGPAKTASLLSALEIGNRRHQHHHATIDTPEQAYQHLFPYSHDPQEQLICLSLNATNQVLSIRVVSKGQSNTVSFHPKDLFTGPITDNATAIIIAHNHPNGSLTPSPADITLTTQVHTASTLLGIPLLDHLIITPTNFYSFAKHGQLPPLSPSL